MRLTSTLVLVLGVVAFAAPASAGNGNGNGNGNGAASPGQSASAPGQLKKDEPAAAPEVATPSTAAPVVASDPAPSVGVKSSNDTAHETHAPAASDRTKEYGNGRAAGAIAQKNGASPQTILHGPGNSQPHKAAPCSGGHEVDVHALKSHNRRGHCGGSPSPPSSSSPPSTAPHPPTSIVVAERPARPAALDPAQPVLVADPKGAQPAPRATAPRDPAEQAGSAQGVLAETARADRGELPFTGLELRLALLAGLALILMGVAIRTAAARVESGRDHTHRRPDGPHGALAAVRARTRR